MNAKHTPGPWMRGHDESGRDFEVRASNGRKIVAMRVDENRAKSISEWGQCKKENEANARLIAAAPELLEALREMLTCYGDCGADAGGFKHLQRARAAIATATGSEA